LKHTSVQEVDCASSLYSSKAFDIISVKFY
jgi:hypothetical protein